MKLVKGNDGKMRAMTQGFLEVGKSHMPFPLMQGGTHVRMHLTSLSLLNWVMTRIVRLEPNAMQSLSLSLIHTPNTLVSNLACSTHKWAWKDPPCFQLDLFGILQHSSNTLVIKGFTDTAARLVNAETWPGLGGVQNKKKEKSRCTLIYILLGINLFANMGFF